MALEVNNQNLFQNAQFQQFVDFAENAAAAGKQKAVARLDAGELGGIVNRTIKPGSGDWVGIGVGRLSSLKRANNITREAFMKAVSDMFGGENHIPASVKDAMKLEDYGKGKPLTARRILAVKAAIDAVKLETFQSADTEQIALNMGFVKSEFPKLARAAHFYAQAAGLSELDAMKAVAEPGSKPNRLMQYGGRFLESAQNFADGLRLMDSYAEWSKDLIDTMAPVHKQASEVRDYSTADTPTKLNINSKFLNGERMRGIEKFVFEELAANPAHDLSGKDPEKLFGFENNAAMRFIGRDYGNSVLSTIANIPPAKRAVVYAAYDLFTRNVTNAEEAHEQTLGGGRLYKRQIDPGTSATVLARLLRNFDRLEAMYNKGTLTARNIIDKFFPDIQDKGNYDCTTLKTHFDGISILLRREEDEDGGNPYSDLNVGLFETTMNNCGTTLEETADALRNNRMPPIPKMLSTGSIELEAFDGTTTGGRKLVAADADRPQNYVIKGNPRKLLKDPAFGFSFPDGTRLETNGKHMDNIPAVCDKVENLCGRVHVAQANSVMLMLSQSGLTYLRAGVPSLGLGSDEHSAVDYSLSKDATTGAVTIRYESPAELPVHFSWTATVDVDGNVTSTPLEVLDKATAPNEAIAKMLPISGKATGEIGKIILPGSGLADAESPAAELKTRMNKLATANAQTHAMRSITDLRTAGKGSKIDFAKYPPAFKEDLDRNFSVRIGEDPLLHTLGAEKARDAYVVFITDGRIKTYAEADEKTKLKACLLMSFSNQGLPGIGIKGVGNAFDPNGNVSRLVAGREALENNRTDSLTLSKDSNGNFVIHSSTVFKSPKLILKDEKQSTNIYSTNEGSSLEYDLNVTITAESLEKLANADWEDFDSDANRKIENDITVPHCIERAADALPEDLKLDVKVDVSFSVNADQIAEMM